MVTPSQLKRRAALFEQLAAMIAAGVTLSQAMEMAGRNRSVGIPRAIIQEIAHLLQEGHTFTDAMQLASGQKRGNGLPPRRANKQYWLPEFDVALLSAGEESGRLDATFRLLARYYNARAQIIRDTIASLFTTLLTLHVFLLIFPITLLQRFALGIINSQYLECVPFLLEKALVFGGLYFGFWFIAFANQGNRAEGWRAMVESVFNLVPLLRSSVKDLAVARLAMALDALLRSGVSVIRAWELAAVSCGSPHLKREILQRLPKVEAGSTPGEMVAQIAYFPDMFMQLYQSGEISGKLDETLARLHTYFEDEGFRLLQSFCRILNFVIYFAIVIAVAINVIGFWSKYYGSLSAGF
jgi:type II secretory pathway component PulF